KKLALLMAAIMTVAMVPATAFASTKLTAVDEVTTGVDKIFASRVELRKSNDQVDVTDTYVVDDKGTPDTADDDIGFDVVLKLTNGTFAKDEDIDNDYDDKYIMDSANKFKIGLTPVYETYQDTKEPNSGILGIDVTSSTSATVTLNAKNFNADDDPCVLTIVAKATATGDVVGAFSSNVSAFKKASEVIANAADGDAEVTIDGVQTFVEDGPSSKYLKDININELTPAALKSGEPITLKLKGNFKFVEANFEYLPDGSDEDKIPEDNENVYVYPAGDPQAGQINTSKVAQVELLNESGAEAYLVYVDDDEAKLFITGYADGMISKITISNLELATKKADAGDVATITVSSKDFDSVKLEAAKMVEEAVTYSVEDKTLPTIWAGKKYVAEDEANTLKLSVVENTGDILNTSRKATFTFPEGIEVVDVTGDKGLPNYRYEIDENVVTIYDYAKGAETTGKVDMSLKFILAAAPTFSGDVTVTLGGQFDDTSFKVATVKAPYTVEAKTSEVLIDYRYVPVNDIVITEAEDGILDDGDQIVLAVEKMNFEDAGKVEVTEGDIDVDVDVDSKGNADLYESKDADYLVVTVKDASTEASTIVISGLELYLDRTLPVGGYALQNVGGMLDKDDKAVNILWENSTLIKVSDDKLDDELAYDFTPGEGKASNGLFKYKAVTANEEYVNVITAARDQDDSMTTKKIVITVGATTMAAGTETVTLDAPAYINAANYTMLPLRAISEAFNATVNWDDATKTVTILSGQRIISMTIGSKTMYINGTPVAMNTAPEITATRTFVPVRDLANALGISNVNWTEASGTVTLN
ncbi:MAG: copper amine oxidase N-terminal domain-containing protein, partial [Candidatus Metalachnospira sp.]|nr:copper amine oxidase N-terminal domain-containing protein [Candidatus Metalachnospira sp.]